MPDDRVSEYLRAEEEANQLLEELTRLQKEIESYSSARGTLQAASDSVKDLCGKLAGACVRFSEVVKTLETIGTPELIRLQNEQAKTIASLDMALQGKLAAVLENVEKSSGSISSSITKATKTIGDLSGVVDASTSHHQEAQEKIVNTMGQLASQAGLQSLQEKLTAQRQQDQQNLKSEFEIHGQHVGKLRSLVIGATIWLTIAVAGAAAVLYVIFQKS